VTKHEAFLAQARSDYATFSILLAHSRDSVPECHPLHYLQMATEKLAKAFFARSGARSVDRSHAAFSFLAAELARRHDVLRAIGYRDPAKTAVFLNRATPLFGRLETLCPSEANRQARDRGLEWDQGENAEYPWRPTSAQDWVAPANRSFATFSAIFGKGGDGASMLRLVQWLIANFERIP